ncbi:MAG: hypothetical protein ACI3T2_09610, partial [Anaerovibrio sp.]
IKTRLDIFLVVLTRGPLYSIPFKKRVRRKSNPRTIFSLVLELKGYIGHNIITMLIAISTITIAQAPFPGITFLLYTQAAHKGRTIGSIISKYILCIYAACLYS